MTNAVQVTPVWLDAVAGRLIADLAPYLEPAGFVLLPRAKRTPCDTETDGWYVPLARHRRRRGTVFQLWCDRWADVRRYTLWYGFETRDLRMARALRDAGRPWLGPAIERSVADARDEPFQHRAIPLTEDEFQHATYEDGVSYAFYGRYVKSRPPWSAHQERTVRARACDFFARLTVGAGTKSWGSDSVGRSSSQPPARRMTEQAARRALETRASAAAAAAALDAENADTATGQRAGRGRQVDPAVRKVIEERAIAVVTEHLTKERWDITPVGKWCSYDLHCTKGTNVLRVEVKGTTTAGRRVQVTAQEVALALRHPEETALYIVHSIEVERTPDGIRATAGDIRSVRPWRPSNTQLVPLAYEWCVTKDDVVAITPRDTPPARS